MKPISVPGCRLLAAVLILLCSSLPHAQESPDRRNDLLRLEGEIATLKKSIADLRTESSTVVRDVERYRLQREMHAREIARYGIDIRVTDETIDRLEREIADNNQIIAGKRDAVAGLLRRLYMNGRFDRLKALLNVPSARDVALAHTYLTFLARADFELLTSYRAAVDRLKADQRSLDREKSRLVILRDEEKAKEREAATAQREQERILDGIRRKSGIYEKALREKEVSRRELVQFLSRLGEAESSGGSAGSGFERLRGALAWPAQGEVIAGFGAIRDQTYDVTIENDGIDIKASIGTPVNAVAAGTAVYCGWQDAGGNMVVVDHGSGYYTLYAHLSRFSVETGAAIEAGQQIGEVGETGSLKGPILHFEIRRIMRGQEPRALDPVAWLRKSP